MTKAGTDESNSNRFGDRSDAQPPPEWRNFLGLGGNKRLCDGLFTAPDIAQARLEIVGKPPF
jgi:hypothetical protein